MLGHWLEFSVVVKDNWLKDFQFFQGIMQDLELAIDPDGSLEVMQIRFLSAAGGDLGSVFVQNILGELRGVRGGEKTTWRWEAWRWLDKPYGLVVFFVWFLLCRVCRRSCFQVGFVEHGSGIPLNEALSRDTAAFELTAFERLLDDKPREITITTLFYADKIGVTDRPTDPMVALLIYAPAFSF